MHCVLNEYTSVFILERLRASHRATVISRPPVAWALSPLSVFIRLPQRGHVPVQFRHVVATMRMRFKDSLAKGKQGERAYR